MIKNNQPLSMGEAKEYIKKSDGETDVLGFINKFTKITSKEAKEMRTKLEALELMKLKKENIVKIIDLMQGELLSPLFIATLMRPDVKKCAHNAAFEYGMILRHGYDCPHNFYDTMIMGVLYNENMPQGLKPTRCL